MPSITARTSVPANSQTNNVVEGSSFEFLEVNSVIRLNMVVTDNGNYDIQCLFQIGGTTILQPPYALVFPINLFNNYPGSDPTIPNEVYHSYITRGASAGERLFMSFTNGGGTARNVNWVIRIDAV